MAESTVRTTVTLPQELLEATDRAVQEGQAKSRNELVARALRHELAALRRSAIDAAFAEMAEDRGYQAEAREILGEFEQADVEALRLGHEERRGEGGERE